MLPEETAAKVPKRARQTDIEATPDERAGAQRGPINTGGASSCESATSDNDMVCVWLGSVCRAYRIPFVRRRCRRRINRRNERGTALAERGGQSKSRGCGLIRQIRSLRRRDGREMPIENRTQGHLVSMERHRAHESTASADRA